jgi:hypothetical protein
MQRTCALAIDAFAAGVGGFFLGVFITGVVIAFARIASSRPAHFPEETEHFPAARVEP